MEKNYVLSSEFYYYMTYVDKLIIKIITTIKNNKLSPRKVLYKYITTAYILVGYLTAAYE